MLLTSAFSKGNLDISLEEFNVFTTVTRKLGVKHILHHCWSGIMGFCQNDKMNVQCYFSRTSLELLRTAWRRSKGIWVDFHLNFSRRSKYTCTVSCDCKYFVCICCALPAGLHVFCPQTLLNDHKKAHRNIPVLMLLSDFTHHYHL